VQFIWDENKRRQNLANHGIDFREARKIFAGSMLESLDMRRDYGEDRFIAIGLIEGEQ
jgi:uncharacterized protein